MVAIDRPETEHRRLVAHAWRRCSFAGLPHGTDELDAVTASEVAESLIERTEERALDPALFEQLANDDEDLDRDEIFRHFVDGLLDLANPFHERMTWYWHTHFTTSAERVGSPLLIWRQHERIRTHAMGNFRELLRAVTTDAAMLLYLDGNGSEAEEPNENHARELLELFTMGRAAGWHEDDVRAGAHIMSGWQVDHETGDVSFDSERHYARPVTFLGERRRWQLDDLIDAICAQPECHRHVVTRLYHHFVGPAPSRQRIDELAQVFRSNDLELRPLMLAMLIGPDFEASVRSRAQQPLEWVMAALRATGIGTFAAAGIDAWHMHDLGQMPLMPPNVAGWPLDDRWSSANQMLLRARFLAELELPEQTWDDVEPTADAVLTRCGVFSPSNSTLAALRAIEDDVSEYDGRLEALFMSALLSPEFSLL